MNFKERVGIDHCVDEEIAKLKAVYPDGLLGYYYHDPRELSRVTMTLKEALPSTLVFPITDLSGQSDTGFPLQQSELWPADIGTQVGSNFYGVASRMEGLLYPGLDEEILHPDFLFVEQNGNLQKHFPHTFADITHDQPMTIEGGCYVPIAGADAAVYVPQIYFDYDDVSYAFDQAGIELLQAPSAYEWRPSLYQAMTRLAIDHPDDWTFANRHIDVLLTGIYDRRSQTPLFFVDELLWDFLHRQEQESGDVWVPDWMRKAKPVSHDFVQKGSLNVSYMRSEGKTVAVCADISAMDSQQLDAYDKQGIEICEVGADQVMYKGGPKCRSMKLTWQD